MSVKRLHIALLLIVSLVLPLKESYASHDGFEAFHGDDYISDSAFYSMNRGNNYFQLYADPGLSSDGFKAHVNTAFGSLYYEREDLFIPTPHLPCPRQILLQFRKHL
jgi:hypothetical protein